MEEKKQIKEIASDYYYSMLAETYRIRPEMREVFIKRIKTYSMKLDRDMNGGNKGIHKIDSDELS